MQGGNNLTTQKQIAAHLDLSQGEVSKHLAELALDARTSTLEEIRIAYIRKLRGVASGHKSHDGMDLTRERVLTEKVDRELKELLLAEKRGQLVNIAQLEPELTQMVVAFRTELLARDDKLKADLDVLYAIDLDLTVLNDHTHDTLQQLARYAPELHGIAAPDGGPGGAAASHDHDGMGAAISPAVG